MRSKKDSSMGSMVGTEQAPKTRGTQKKNLFGSIELDKLIFLFPDEPLIEPALFIVVISKFLITWGLSIAFCQSVQAPFAFNAFCIKPYCFWFHPGPSLHPPVA